MTVCIWRLRLIHIYNTLSAECVRGSTISVWLTPAHDDCSSKSDAHAPSAPIGGGLIVGISFEWNRHVNEYLHNAHACVNVGVEMYLMPYKRLSRQHKDTDLPEARATVFSLCVLWLTINDALLHIGCAEICMCAIHCLTGFSTSAISVSCHQGLKAAILAT